jgi:hypothetical protein
MFRLMKMFALIAVGMLALTPVMACKDSATMLENMGGMEGLTKFNDAFGTALMANPAVSKFLDEAAIGMVKKGVTTEVAKMSGMPLPSDGVDLATFLKEKNMDEAGVKGFRDSATKAAQDAAFSPTASKGMMSMLDGVLKGL